VKAIDNSGAISILLKNGQLPKFTISEPEDQGDVDKILKDIMKPVNGSMTYFALKLVDFSIWPEISVYYTLLHPKEFLDEKPNYTFTNINGSFSAQDSVAVRKAFSVPYY
jgi:hypothetical protein